MMGEGDLHRSDIGLVLAPSGSLWCTAAKAYSFIIAIFNDIHSDMHNYMALHGLETARDFIDCGRCLWARFAL